MKKFFLAISIISILIQPAFAEIIFVTKEDVPAATYYANDTNKLVFKLNLIGSGSDTLNSIVLTNQGTATQPADIVTMKLWYQASGGAFNPGTATLVCILDGTGSKTWEKSSIDFTVQAGSSLYVTADISSAPTDGRTIKIKLSKNDLSIGLSTFPSANLTNTSAQTISCPAKLVISYIDMMPAKVNTGQQNIQAVKYTFQNTGTVAISITNIIFRTINYSGEINANTALSRIVIKSGVSTYADLSTIPASPQVSITLSPVFSLPGGTEDSFDVYIYLLPGINTHDIGIRLAQASDVTTASEPMIKEAKTGYSFPMDTSLALLTQHVSSVNVSRTDIMPTYATEGQQDLKSLLLTFSHPESITTYADIAITGITLTVTSLTDPGLKDDDFFTGLSIYDNVTTYADISTFAGVNQIFIPFSNYITISPGSSKSVTISVDLTQGKTDENFYLSVSTSADIKAMDASDNTLISANGTFPLDSGVVMIQKIPSEIDMHHINRMPSVVTTGQQFVYAEDFIFTHPDSGNVAPIEIKGVTLNVEDNLGNTITPSTVISKVTILDAMNNTLVSYSSIPASGYKMYIDFLQTLIISPSSSETIKVYIDIPSSPQGSYVKLNLNSSLNVNAVDGNSHTISVLVKEDAGDLFPMKTSAAQILNEATDVKVKHTDTMPLSANMGQENIVPMLLNFLNDSGGIVSVEQIKFCFFDNAGNSIPANSVINNIKIDNAVNTLSVYVDTAVTTNSAELDVTLTSPILINYGTANSITTNVKVNIANPATNNNFKICIIAGTSITAKDYNTGNTITVLANNDAFPMSSSILNIEQRATDVNVSHDGTNAGSAFKGDGNVQVMDLIFENPGGLDTCDVLITGLTLTVEDSSNITINATTAISKIVIENKSNTSLVYGQITSIPSSPYLYFDFATPITVQAGASNNVTCSVKVDVSAFATTANFRLDLYSASYVRAIDENEMQYVTVSAKAPDTFPMRSDVINISSVNKITVLHTDTMPETVSNGQKGVKPFILRFANASDNPVAIRGITLTVEDITSTGIVPSEIIDKIYLIDAVGNTNISTTSIPGTGDKIYLNFAQDITVSASSFNETSVFVDIKNNTYVANFQLNLASASAVYALPLTITVESDSSDSFPMRSGNALIQLVPSAGGISHTDVIPTTVSTGQTDIFAEILNIANYNITGTADIMLTGITITVEDDTNTMIDPSTALKKIMIRDESNIYAFFSGIPSAASSFYVPFTTPAYVSVSQTTDLKLYVDIVDTISTGTFQITIKINNDVTFRDRNTGLTVTAQPINGDSFPMRTSVVIIQEKATMCRVSYQDMMPVAVNKGQQAITAMRISFTNEGSASGANVLITRMTVNIEDNTDTGIIPKTAISRLYVKDAAGTVYGDVITIPDYGDSVSIALTTPITVQVGERKDVFIICDINTDATAAGFKINLKTGSNVIARDANSYDIINVAAASGYLFPMRSSYTEIQNVSQILNIHHYGSITPTVNKGDTDIPVMYLEFKNPNPSGYSTIEVKGIIITVEDETGAGIIPSNVITKLKLEGASVYGVAVNMPSSGSSVYIPLTLAAMNIASGAYIGATLYADIAASTNELYLQFDLKQGSDCYAEDVNSGNQISSVVADTGDSFPMRSGYTTIINPPGILVLHTDLSPVTVSGGQKDIGIFKFKFSNIGSFSEYITGLTLTVKDEWNNDADAGMIIDSSLIVDNTGNTISGGALFSGSNLYLNMTTTPISIPPQDYKEIYVYVDVKDTTFSANFYISLATALDVEVASSVSPDASDTFPMNTKLISLQQPSNTINISNTDWMPPTVSTGQKDVFAFSLNFENNNPAGYSPVIIKGITITVKDALSNTISADTAITRLIFTDLTTDYLNTTAIPSDNILAYDFTTSLTLTAGTSKEIYCIVDITGNTTTMVDNFKLSIESDTHINAEDFNSGSYVTVVAKTGYSYPLASSVTYIQKRATKLEISHVDKMPANVSSGQDNVTAMDLILTNAGDLKTSSIMVTRINFYIQDLTDTDINPLNVIKGITVTSEDGLTVYGANTTLSSTKITVNLTAPIIISTAAPVTVKVKVGIADTYLNDNFKVSLDTNTDIYALDANSFELINVANKLPDVFPMKSGLTYIEAKVSNIGLNNFTSLLSPVITRGDSRVPLFTFKIEDTLNTLSANAEFCGITITVKNVSDTDISANSVIDTLYVIDGNGVTLGSNTTGVSNKIAVKFISSYSISPQSAHYITIYADILSTATANDFKVLLETEQDISIKDENSKLEVVKTISPAMPWETGIAGVYNAPATDLHVWHSNYAPTQVGSGQTDVRFISLSLYNPGGPGTSKVIVEGVTVTVIDAGGTTLSPADMISYIRVSDFIGQTGYGWITTTTLTTPQSIYIDFSNSIEVEASNTKTVYFVADISSSTVLANFKTRITLPENITAHNYPSGGITVSAQNGDSFPLDSGTVSKIATTYILSVGHTNLMPISVAGGDKDIEALKLNFENKNAGQYIDITGITLTVKDKSGNIFAADKVISALRIVDTGGNTVYGMVSTGTSGKIFVSLLSFRVDKLDEKAMIIKIDVKENANESFYIELEKEGDLITNPSCTIQAAQGDYFGDIKSSVTSIQEADLVKSFHNFPNPFNPEEQETRIEYYLNSNANVTIKIFTLDGRSVKNIILNQFKAKGLHYEDTWNGLNEVNAKVKSGVYLCVLEVKYIAGGSKKLIIKIAVLR